MTCTGTWRPSPPAGVSQVRSSAGLSPLTIAMLAMRPACTSRAQTRRGYPGGDAHAPRVDDVLAGFGRVEELDTRVDPLEPRVAGAFQEERARPGRDQG